MLVIALVVNCIVDTRYQQLSLELPVSHIYGSIFNAFELYRVAEC